LSALWLPLRPGLAG